MISFPKIEFINSCAFLNYWNLERVKIVVNWSKMASNSEAFNVPPFFLVIGLILPQADRKRSLDLTYFIILVRHVVNSPFWKSVYSIFEICKFDFVKWIINYTLKSNFIKTWDTWWRVFRKYRNIIKLSLNYQNNANDVMSMFNEFNMN